MGRLFSIIWMGPKCNHMCPHKEAERDLINKGNKRYNDGSKRLQEKKGQRPRNTGRLQLGETWKHTVPQSFQKEHTCGYLGFILVNFISDF